MTNTKRKVLSPTERAAKYAEIHRLLDRASDLLDQAYRDHCVAAGVSE